jgi:hypothetical protein
VTAWRGQWNGDWFGDWDGDEPAGGAAEILLVGITSAEEFGSPVVGNTETAPPRFVPEPWVFPRNLPHEISLVGIKSIEAIGRLSVEVELSTKNSDNSNATIFGQAVVKRGRIEYEDEMLLMAA